MEKNNHNIIEVDKITNHVIMGVLYNSYLLTHKGDIITTGYSKDYFENLDNKYKNIQGYIDINDLQPIIKGLDWMIGVTGAGDDSTLLDINQQQGIRLVALLKEKKTKIESGDWYI